MSGPPGGWQAPKANWSSVDPIANADLNRVEGNINAIESGLRVVNDYIVVPPSNQGTLRELLSRYAAQLRTAIGDTNWHGWPGTHLRGLSQLVPILPDGSGYKYRIAGATNATAMTTGAPTANVLRAMPLLVTKYENVNSLAINVTTAVAGNAIMGIYNSAVGTGLPNTLIDQTIDVSTGTTGIREVTTGAGVLDPGLYYLALVTSAAPTIRALTVAGCHALASGDMGTAFVVGFSAPHTYGPLPLTFPFPITPITAPPIPAIAIAKLDAGG